VLCRYRPLWRAGHAFRRPLLDVFVCLIGCGLKTWTMRWPRPEVGLLSHRRGTLKCLYIINQHSAAEGACFSLNRHTESEFSFAITKFAICFSMAIYLVLILVKILLLSVLHLYKYPRCPAKRQCTKPCT